MNALFPEFACIDCDECTLTEKHEYYMVRDDVWHEAGAPDPGIIGGGMLCIDCLEDRLGRRLTTADFAHVPLNALNIYPGANSSQELQERICGLD